MPVLGRDVRYSWVESDPFGWLDGAACRTLPVDVFFPAKGDGYGFAKRICSRCPVLEACRAEIDRVERHLPGSDMHGCFAGETPSERRRRRNSDDVTEAASDAASAAA